MTITTITILTTAISLSLLPTDILAIGFLGGVALGVAIGFLLTKEWYRGKG